MKPRTTAVAVGLCWVAFLGVGSAIAHRQSATKDEVPHLAAGVGYLAGDMRLNHEHPPLVKVMAALALGLDRPPALPDHVDASTQWSFGDALLHRGAPGEALRLLGRARMPVVVLASLLLLCVAYWAQQLAGGVAAVSAAFFAAACPLWYAHATLVTTDAAVSVFTLGAALCMNRVLRTRSASTQPTLAWLAALALSVALGMASKYSMLVSVGGLGLAALLAAIALRNWRALAWVWATLLVSSALGSALAWGWPPSLGSYVEGVSQVGANHTAGYPFFAFGSFFLGVGAEPLYFARALLVKLEWPLILSACVGLTRLVVRSLARVSGTEHSAAFQVDLACLVVVPGVYLITMSLFAPAIGVRYVLPVVPFAFVCASVCVAELARMRAAWLLIATMAALELLALRQAWQTSPIAWFNGFPCQTSEVPACLDDSNVDWGQSLPALADYRNAHFAGEPIRVFEFVRNPLPAYIARASEAEPIELMQPYRSLYAASLHSLLRMPPISPFKQLRPEAVVGGSFAVFDLRAVDALAAAPAR